MSNQAAWLDGKDQKLRVAEAPMPKAGDDEVLIKNKAIAINPVDWKVQDTGMFIQNWPIVLGCDSAGEVQEVGSNVKNVKKGDRVIGHAHSLVKQQSQYGAFQNYTLVSSAVVSKIPDSMSFAEASVLPLAVNTAAAGLYQGRSDGFLGFEYPTWTPTQSGKTLVVYGGSSSVGALVTQLAVASGTYVIAVASQRNHEFCKSNGASEVFDYNNSSVVDDIVKAVKNAEPRNFVGVYDTISTKDSYKITVPILEKIEGGNLVVTLPGPESVPQGSKVGNVFAIHPSVNPLWETFIPQGLAEGKLKAVPSPMVVGKGLENVQKGCDTNKQGVSAKKVVIEL